MTVSIGRGYISSTDGAKTMSTPDAVHNATSASSERGYC
jgi:hypothetical protein